MAAGENFINSGASSCVSLEIQLKEKKLTDSEKIVLIKDLEDLPILWNSKEKSPNKAAEKTKATKVLAEKHGITCEGLKKILHSLRTSMTREIKKKQEQDGYVPNWKFYGHMEFLKEEIVKSLLQSEKIPWTEEETTTLIEFYRENPCMWNHCIADYRDRNAKHLAMERLKELMKRFTEEEIKSHWHGLKTVFDREDKREKGSKKSGGGTAEVYNSSWKYFSLLMFVKDCADVDDSTSTLTITKQSEFEDEPVPFKIKRSAKALKEVHAARVDLYKSAIEALKCSSPDTSDEMTEEESFGKMVAKTLARFNGRQKAIARKKINDVLFEVDMGDIENTMFPSHFSGFYNQNNAGQLQSSYNPVQNYTFS